MIVIGLDPGTYKSAFVALADGVLVMGHNEVQNEELVECLPNNLGRGNGWAGATLVIEEFESYGMAIGRESIRTVRWTGCFEMAWGIHRTKFLPRRVVKQHLCHTARATDSNIRQAILDRFGGEKAIGKKATPGPLYGLKGHEFAALAVALTWFDQHKDDGEQVRPGLTQEW